MQTMAEHNLYAYDEELHKWADTLDREPTLFEDISKGLEAWLEPEERTAASSARRQTHLREQLQPLWELGIYKTSQLEEASLTNKPKPMRRRCTTATISQALARQLGTIDGKTTAFWPTSNSNSLKWALINLKTPSREAFRNLSHNKRIDEPTLEYHTCCDTPTDDCNETSEDEMETESAHPPSLMSEEEIGHRRRNTTYAPKKLKQIWASNPTMLAPISRWQRWGHLPPLHSP